MERGPPHPKLMSILKHFLPPFVLRPYRNLQQRLDRVELSVRCLEWALDAMIVSPKYTPADDIGFNGQAHRKRMFSEIISAVPLDAIVETGTWLGNSTGYMAQTALRPVTSCELSPRFHALAKMRLADLDRIQLQQGDSRRFLSGLAATELAKKSVFFYLDAHWYDDLPLGEEMETIGDHWKQFVIMIDDFQVPDDSGYGYDSYGDGKALTLELLRPAMTKYNLAAYFPSARSDQETGARRGSVVFTRTGEFSEKLSRLKSLRQWR
jgi:hypothetical protein